LELNAGGLRHLWKGSRVILSSRTIGRTLAFLNERVKESNISGFARSRRGRKLG
jgi:hypothetical protein